MLLRLEHASNAPPFAITEKSDDRGGPLWDSKRASTGGALWGDLLER
jgi:hypothetical protein